MSLTIQSGGSITLQGGAGGGGGGATVGTYASRPAAGNAGALYICTDSPIAQWVDDGSAWRPMILGQALGTQVPAASAFTAFGAAGFTFSDNNGTIDLSCAGTGSTALKGAAISLSSATAYVQAAFANTEKQSTVSTCCVVLRESSSGKAVAAAMTSNPAAGAERNYVFSGIYTNSGRATIDQTIAPTPNGPTILRVHRSGGSTIVSYSSDGRTWTALFTYGAGVFDSAPDQVAFAAEPFANTSGRLLHFKYGSL